MGRKGKSQKHTAKEIAGKHKAAKEKAGAAGHGGKGLQARKEAQSRIKLHCKICKQEAAHMKAMEMHYESKHPKEPFSKNLYDFGSVRSEVIKDGKKTQLKKDEVAAKPKKTSTKKKNDLSALDGY